MAEPVRRDEGRRRQAAQGARAGERPTEADPGRQGAGQFDVTATARTIKILHVVDEFTRESLADLVGHSIDADATVACLDKIIGARGRHLEFICCDNGPELTAKPWGTGAAFGGAGAAYIEPASPWENPWVESCDSRMRDELLGIEQFDTLL